MKKILVVSLATLSCAWFSYVNDWEKNYTCIDPCGNLVIISHSAEDILYSDYKESTYIFSKKDLKIDVAPNGCAYNILLKIEVSEDEFEQTLADANFKFVGKVKK